MQFNSYWFTMNDGMLDVSIFVDRKSAFSICSAQSMKCERYLNS